LKDALEIRRRVLLAYELAERDAVERNAEQRNARGNLETGHAPSVPGQPQQREVSLVVIGGGPTGVELAGALADIARYALAYDFRHIDPRRSRVILLEGGPRVLPAYAPDLSRSAQEQVTALGVEVRTNTLVTAIEPCRVRVQHAAAPSAVVS
jgi:NADH:quinone reductase (non-electrogenic)